MGMYSLHSWIGLIGAILFTFQWLAGFIIFALPIFNSNIRTLYLKNHAYLGQYLFAISVITVLLGLTEKLIFVSAYDANKKGFYQQKEFEGILMNLFGIIVVLFATPVLY